MSFPIADGLSDPRIWYWTRGEAVVNFGDALAEVFAARLFVEPRVNADVYHTVGSVICHHLIEARRHEKALPIPLRIAYWACGARTEESIWPQSREACLFHGVRGPLSRDVLDLPADTPMGDPGFLLPLLVPPPASRSGASLLVPHYYDGPRAEELRRQAGADAVVLATTEPTLAAIDALVQRIAAADFVLAGSLHSAVVAAAYDTPFAFLDCDHIDLPFKWRDLAASLDIPPIFARTVEEGRALYAGVKDRIRKPALAPLLAVCPYTVRSSLFAAAVAADGGSPMKAALEAGKAFANPAEENETSRYAAMRARVADQMDIRRLAASLHDLADRTRALEETDPSPHRKSAEEAWAAHHRVHHALKSLEDAHGARNRAFAELEQELTRTSQERDASRQEIDAMRRSTSWRLLAPLRTAARLARLTRRD
jgi:hypothetical protein